MFPPLQLPKIEMFTTVGNGIRPSVEQCVRATFQLANDRLMATPTPVTSVCVFPFDVLVPDPIAADPVPSTNVRRLFGLLTILTRAVPPRKRNVQTAAVETRRITIAETTVSLRFFNISRPTRYTYRYKYARARILWPGATQKSAARALRRTRRYSAKGS